MAVVCVFEILVGEVVSDEILPQHFTAAFKSLKSFFKIKLKVKPFVSSHSALEKEEEEEKQQMEYIVHSGFTKPS